MSAQPPGDGFVGRGVHIKEKDLVHICYRCGALVNLVKGQGSDPVKVVRTCEHLDAPIIADIKAVLNPRR